MKIHFISAVDNNKSICSLILKIIEKQGHQIVTKHYLERTIEQIEDETPDESKLYTKKTRQWINQADAIIIETTKADVSIGYELACCIHSNKPIVALYKRDGGNVPYSLKGLISEKVQSYDYDIQDLQGVLISAIEYIEAQPESKFNLFINGEISSYLKWASETRKVPKAVLVRNLIVKAIREDIEFLKS